MTKTKWFLSSVLVSTLITSAAFAQNTDSLKPEDLKQIQEIRAKLSESSPERDIKVTMYPNPTKNIVSLSANTGDWTIDHCEIYNILGLKVLDIPGNKFEIAENAVIAKFDFTQLRIRGEPAAEGVYMVKFYFTNDDNTTSTTRKLIYSSKD